MKKIEPIIGDKNSLVYLQKLGKLVNENWSFITNITLSYEKIVKFYSSNSFTFLDYKHLLKQMMVKNA